MYTITLTTTKLVKNPNTKTTYIVDKVETEIITDKQHYYATNDDTVKFFRRLGGKETITRAYTCAGYKVVKVVSTSPDKQSKTIREYKFKSN